MEHTVKVSVKLGQGVVVTQEFSQICDDEEEANDFGKNAATLQLAFLAGYGEVAGD